MKSINRKVHKVPIAIGIRTKIAKDLYFLQLTFVFYHE
jgi:hypothetical protein